MQSSGDTSADAQRETASPLFVINLCASTTPVALAHPDSAELKKYTFFVTRRREEGRERFRLHMGYFETLADAESLLGLVRDVYPAAWCGPAPDGRAAAKRAARAATPKAAVAPAPLPAAPSAPTIVPAPEPPAPAPAAALPVAVPVAPPPPLAAVAPEPTPVAPVAPPASASEPGPVRIAAPTEEVSFELEAMSNVREVIAQLADEPAKPAPILKAVETARPVAPVAPPAAAAKPAAKKASVLSPKQTLSLLEKQPKGAKAAKEPDIAVLMPEDTQTLRDIKLEAQSNAPACFAVQLVWAVQPIGTEKLPHLAIFDAYTLYHVEGSRNGRRWYGLRLGFFTDPVAAKQVASYVRSEYATVAVVPVTAKEKAGANRPLSAVPVPQSAPLPRPKGAHIPTVKPVAVAVPSPMPMPPGGVAGFELLAEDPPAPKREVFDEGSGPRLKLGTPVTPVLKSAPKASGKASGKRVVVRQRPAPPGAPNPLEETLEMLGASTLTLDESREIINDVGSRKPVHKAKPGRFAKLLNRLSDRKDG